MPKQNKNSRPSAVQKSKRALLYRDARKRRDKIFYDTVKAFTTSYIKDGQPGFTFRRKDEPSHLAGADAMAKDFLVHHGNGEKFWPQDPASEYYNALQHRKDYKT